MQFLLRDFNRVIKVYGQCLGTFCTRKEKTLFLEATEETQIQLNFSRVQFCVEVRRGFANLRPAPSA